MVKPMLDCLCGRRTFNANRICAACDRKRGPYIRDRIAKAAKDIDVSILTPKQRRAVLLRKKGMTLQEIADSEKVSVQAVNERINRSIERNRKNATTY